MKKTEVVAKELNDNFTFFLTIIIALVVAAGAMKWLDAIDSVDSFLESLREFDISGILMLLAAALASTFRSSAGRLSFIWTLSGAAVFIFSKLLLGGLPNLNGDFGLRLSYAVLGCAFYLGFVISMVSAVVGILDSRKPSPSQSLS
ncbi:hypothetical protein [Salinicola socius]|uniref:Uncharacterized protein n=1 Tax=Salinicola socius TaxID=404433 RepID=A0A1Q8SUG6_9GAMM|nr:hypothetical protein [Salinicola socius]OLO05099.1 hypothetical protein BTW07_05655 [Salinicola socius]